MVAAAAAAVVRPAATKRHHCLSAAARDAGYRDGTLGRTRPPTAWRHPTTHWHRALRRPMAPRRGGHAHRGGTVGRRRLPTTRDGLSRSSVPLRRQRRRQRLPPPTGPSPVIGCPQGSASTATTATDGRVAACQTGGSGRRGNRHKPLPRRHRQRHRRPHAWPRAHVRCALNPPLATRRLPPTVISPAARPCAAASLVGAGGPRAQRRRGAHPLGAGATTAAAAVAADALCSCRRRHPHPHARPCTVDPTLSPTSLPTMPVATAAAAMPPAALVASRHQ